MKGYVTPVGYCGYIPRLGEYMLFPTEEEYLEYLQDAEMGKV